MNRHLRRWGAVYILLVLFLTSWIGHGVFEYASWATEQKEHGQPLVMSEFWVEFGRAKLENWQSEWLQLLGEALLFLGPLAGILWLADQQSQEIAALRADVQRFTQAVEDRKVSDA